MSIEMLCDDVIVTVGDQQAKRKAAENLFNGRFPKTFRLADANQFGGERQVFQRSSAVPILFVSSCRRGCHPMADNDA